MSPMDAAGVSRAAPMHVLGRQQGIFDPSEVIEDIYLMIGKLEGGWCPILRPGCRFLFCIRFAEGPLTICEEVL